MSTDWITAPRPELPGFDPREVLDRVVKTATRLRDHRLAGREADAAAREAQLRPALSLLLNWVHGPPRRVVEDSRRWQALEAARNTRTDAELRAALMEFTRGIDAVDGAAPTGEPPVGELEIPGGGGSFAAPGEVTLLAGAPKSGKSTLLTEWALAGATAAGAGAGLTVRPRPWVIASAEDSPARWGARIRSLRADLPSGGGRLTMLSTRDASLFAPKGELGIVGPTERWPDFWRQARAAVRRGRKTMGVRDGGVIVLDPVAAMIEFSPSDPSAARRFVQMAALETAEFPPDAERATAGVTSDPGCAVILCMHSPKRETGGSVISGSLQFEAAARAVLRVTRIPPPAAPAPAKTRAKKSATPTPTLPAGSVVLEFPAANYFRPPDGGICVIRNPQSGGFLAEGIPMEATP